MRQTSTVLGISIDILTLDKLLEAVERLVTGEAPPYHQIAYLNVDCINQYYRNSAYKEIIDGADLVYADGMGVVWASRLFGVSLPERLTAADFIDNVCQLCQEKGFSIFLLGSEPGVAQMAADKLLERFPKLKVAGVEDGFFDAENEEKVVGRISAASPDILLVGMSVPKQEFWIRRHIDRLGVPVCWGVGALFEFISGFTRRAPKWMGDYGLEWLYRLILEPSRLWRRYLLGNVSFALRAFLLVITDIAAFSLSWIGAYSIRAALNRVFGVPINPFEAYLMSLPLMVFLWVMSCFFFGLYRRPTETTRFGEFVSILKATVLSMLIVMATSFMFKGFDFGRSVVIISIFLNFLALMTSRLVARKIEERHGPTRGGS
ncbi:MAG: WecB/TagA/CpsF family glycosyltransferase [Candidatus Coatesbacteria bacterium]|nr:WecB/TagA/CpsF family glycosyltransferase [Candidatus Coatesbacteria bacterium]